MSKIELKNVTKVYDKTNRAIDDLNLIINDGEFFIFILLYWGIWVKNFDINCGELSVQCKDHTVE